MRHVRSSENVHNRHNSVQKLASKKSELAVCKTLGIPSKQAKPSKPVLRRRRRPEIMHPSQENRPSTPSPVEFPQDEFHADLGGPGNEFPRIVFTTATESYLDHPLRRQYRRDDVDEPEAHEQRRVALR